MDNVIFVDFVLGWAIDIENFECPIEFQPTGEDTPIAPWVCPECLEVPDPVRGCLCDWGVYFGDDFLD